MEILEAEFVFSPMNTRQVLTSLVIDARVLGCVADSLQERCLTRISPTNYKDTKARIFISEIIGGIGVRGGMVVAHRRRGWKQGRRCDLVPCISRGV